MRRSRRTRRGRVPAVPWREALAAAGALAFGLWIGILAGLATRPRHQQPSTPPLNDA
jgi:hypothetical protein